jgi:hypothetical protein
MEMNLNQENKNKVVEHLENELDIKRFGHTMTLGKYKKIKISK